MPYLTRTQIDTRTSRRRQDIESPLFGGTLLIQELSRWDMQNADRFATIPTDLSKVYLLLHTAALFAAGVLDGASGKPMYTADEVSDWRDDADVWDEVVRIVSAIRALSEVGPESLKSGDLPSDVG